MILCRYLFCISLLCHSGLSFCQEVFLNRTRLIDSLKKEAFQGKNDSLKNRALKAIVEHFQNSYPDSSIYYGEIVLHTEQIKRDPTGYFVVKGFMMRAYINKGNLPKALEVGLDAIKEYGNSSLGGMGPVYTNMGDIYGSIGSYDKADYYWTKERGVRGPMGIAFKGINLALMYERRNQLDSSFIMLNESFNAFKSLTFESYPRIHQVYPTWYNARAKLWAKQNEFDKAIRDLRTSLSMTLKNGERVLNSDTYCDLSELFVSIYQLDSAIHYAKQGLAQASKAGYTKGLLRASKFLSTQFESSDTIQSFRYLKLAVETERNLFGAGNIQIIRDMIDKDEQRLQGIQKAEIEYQTRLRMYILFSILGILVIFTMVFYINSKKRNAANAILNKTITDLKSTQSQLIQSEKMASLGELTAGIAHEIQNPLNFVNNFSEVNKELITEMMEEIRNGNYNEAETIAKDINDNQEKINHHGKRADAIVKGMLQHSRSSNGVKEPTDINALCDEYLRLAYHGLRAKDKSFNASMKTEFDNSLEKVSIIPQDIGRVVLNLITNAFHAVDEKKKGKKEGYEPTVTVSTKKEGDRLLISVKDNGNGIPDSIKEKIFQPFFTTKPTGQGTGLGLSLSYDIVKAHGGELKVETKEGEGSEFILIIPVL